MARPIPPQVIPRPQSWQPGGPPPWAAVPEAGRRRISLQSVLSALDAKGQRGPVPDHIGSDRVLGPSIVASELTAPIATSVNSAVLAPFFEEDGESKLIFTRRSTALRNHRGEVSFPGGRIDQGELAVEAALREAYEEVALNPGLVTIAGWIHPVLTLGSGSLIMPVLATLPSRPRLVPSPSEVERVFDVSLADLAEPDVFHEERWSIPGRVIAGSPDNSFAVWFFEVEGEMIWGATARMVHEILSIVLAPTAAAAPPDLAPG